MSVHAYDSWGKIESIVNQIDNYYETEGTKTILL